MTPEEKHLWYDFLKYLPVTAKRQYVIGKYILDFFIPTSNVAIEIDGAQHYETEAKISDSKRDAFLLSQGITVLRYTNIQINTNFQGVILDILKNINIEYEDLKKR